MSKRSLIETVNDQLKNISQIEHWRHRSIWNFFVNLFALIDCLYLFTSQTFFGLDPKRFTRFASGPFLMRNVFSSFSDRL